MLHIFVHIQEKNNIKEAQFSSLFKTKRTKIPFNQPDMLRTLKAALTVLTLVNLLITPEVLLLMQLSLTLQNLP